MSELGHDMNSNAAAGGGFVPQLWQTPSASAPAGSEPAAVEPGRGQEAHGDAPHAGRPSIKTTERFKLSRRDLANLTSQLAIMLQTGIDISSALQSLARQSRHASQSRLLLAIQSDVLDGLPLSKALQPYARVFGPSYIATVAAGEASGKMAQILAQLAQLLRSELRLRNSIRTLSAYPLLLLTVSGFVTVALVMFVLPRFADIFAQFNTPLPMLTHWLLSVATELRRHFWFWGLLVIALGAGTVVFGLSTPGRNLRDRLILHTYFVRDVSRVLLIGRICRLLGLMIDSGVPFLDSLRIVKSSIRNSLYRDLFAAMEQNVINGRGLGEVLIESEFVPASAAEMLMTAERTGTLGSVTQLIGEHFEEEGEVRLRDIVTVVEPLITIGMGVIVAAVVLAVMLPMFDMATFAQG